MAAVVVVAPLGPSWRQAITVGRDAALSCPVLSFDDTVERRANGEARCGV
jgi:hypothetical protein